jgi:phosphate transport system substrate-binding protein
MLKRMAMVAASAMALAACNSGGGGDKAASGPDGSTTAAAAATGAGGQIRVVGSSTVYPYTTAVAEQFKLRFAQFAAPIVESTGTGGGIKLFCEGKGANAPDMVNASRRMKATEYETCKANGIEEVIEIQVGLDGLALARGRNGPDFELSEREIYAALAAEPFGKPQTARTWRDINPALPADRIEVLGPPPTSGTRDSLNELILEDGCNTDPAMVELKKTDADRHKQVCTAIREDGMFVEAGENDNLIVQKLAANPKAIGIFGFGYVEDNLDKVKPVTIEGVTPTFETIASFQYPGARALYVYVRGDRARSKPGLKEFLTAYSSDTAWGPDGYLAQRGLVASPQDVRTAAANAARNLTPVEASAL